MAATNLETKMATVNAQTSDTVTTVKAPIAKSQKKCLVARWLTDENSKLYCQWFIEN